MCFYNRFFVTIAAEHCAEIAHQHGFHFPAIFRNCGYGGTAVRIRICYGSRNTGKSGFYFANNNYAKRSSFLRQRFLLLPIMGTPVQGPPGLKLMVNSALKIPRKIFIFQILQK